MDDESFNAVTEKPSAARLPLRPVCSRIEALLRDAPSSSLSVGQLAQLYSQTYKQLLQVNRHFGCESWQSFLKTHMAKTVHVNDDGVVSLIPNTFCLDNNERARQKLLSEVTELLSNYSDGIQIDAVSNLYQQQYQCVPNLIRLFNVRTFRELLDGALKDTVLVIGDRVYLSSDPDAMCPVTGVLTPRELFRKRAIKLIAEAQGPIRLTEFTSRYLAIYSREPKPDLKDLYGCKTFAEVFKRFFTDAVSVTQPVAGGELLLEAIRNCSNYKPATRLTSKQLKYRELLLELVRESVRPLTLTQLNALYQRKHAPKAHEFGINVLGCSLSVFVSEHMNDVIKINRDGRICLIEPRPCPPRFRQRSGSSNSRTRRGSIGRGEMAGCKDVFVGGLPRPRPNNPQGYVVMEEEIKTFMEQRFGRVIRVCCPLRKEQKAAFAFISFENDDAVKKLMNSVVENSRNNIEISLPCLGKYPALAYVELTREVVEPNTDRRLVFEGCRELFIGGLPKPKLNVLASFWKIGDQLRDYCQNHFGPVSMVHVPMCKEQRQVAFGFVSFKTFEGAQKLLAAIEPNTRNNLQIVLPYAGETPIKAYVNVSNLSKSRDPTLRSRAQSVSNVRTDSVSRDDERAMEAQIAASEDQVLNLSDTVSSFEEDQALGLDDDADVTASVEKMAVVGPLPELNDFEKSLSQLLFDCSSEDQLLDGFERTYETANTSPDEIEFVLFDRNSYNSCRPLFDAIGCAENNILYAIVDLARLLPHQPKVCALSKKTGSEIQTQIDYVKGQLLLSAEWNIPASECTKWHNPWPIAPIGSLMDFFTRLRFIIDIHKDSTSLSQLQDAVARLYGSVPQPDELWGISWQQIWNKFLADAAKGTEENIVPPTSQKSVDLSYLNSIPADLRWIYDCLCSTKAKSLSLSELVQNAQKYGMEINEEKFMDIVFAHPEQFQTVFEVFVGGDPKPQQTCVRLR